MILITYPARWEIIPSSVNICDNRVWLPVDICSVRIADILVEFDVYRSLQNIIVDETS